MVKKIFFHRRCFICLFPVRHQRVPTWALMAYKLIPTASCTASVCGPFFLGDALLCTVPRSLQSLPANSFVGRFCMHFSQEGFLHFFCSKHLKGYVLGEDLHRWQCHLDTWRSYWLEVEALNNMKCKKHFWSFYFLSKYFSWQFIIKRINKLIILCFDFYIYFSIRGRFLHIIVIF